MHKLLSLLEDNSGGFSSMRVTMLAVVGYILVSRIIAQAATGVIPEWSEQDKWILGIVLTAKSYQRGNEQGSNATPVG